MHSLRAESDAFSGQVRPAPFARSLLRVLLKVTLGTLELFPELRNGSAAMAGYGDTIWATQTDQELIDDGKRAQRSVGRTPPDRARSDPDPELAQLALDPHATPTSGSPSQDGQRDRSPQGREAAAPG